MSLAPDHCRICGQALTVHQVVRGGTCDDVACRSEAVKRWARQKREDEERRRENLARGEISQLQAAHARSFDQPITLVVLTALDTAIETVSQQRRDQFRTHISSIAANAGATTVGSIEEVVEDRPSRAQTVACTTCRGHCCRTGGDTAYLDEQTFARVLHRSPELTQHTLVDTYMAALPEKGVSGSCLFHGPEGCALARSLRARVCNEFFCAPIRNWLIAAPQGEPSVAAIVVVDEEKVLRSALIEP